MARFGDLGEDTFGGGMGSPSQVNNDNFYDKIKTTMDQVLRLECHLLHLVVIKFQVRQ